MTVSFQEEERMEKALGMQEAETSVPSCAEGLNLEATLRTSARAAGQHPGGACWEAGQLWVRGVSALQQTRECGHPQAWLAFACLK